MKTLAGVMLACLVFASCGVKKNPFIKDGKEYGVTKGLFRGKWWNYFERGVSYSDGGFFKEAEEDFKAAINQRSDDQRRARTYGMHFVDYFPHRELGIIYHRMNRQTDAIRELETSLENTQSAKAKFFLNQARRELLNQTGADKLPPLLELRNPMDGAVVNEFHASISGLASDDQFVSSVKINGKPLLLEPAAQRFAFEERIPLQEGVNEIIVAAEDLTGKLAKKTLKIISDRRGPTIYIEETTRQNSKVKISVHIFDDSGVSGCKLNGRNLDLIPGREVILSPTLELAPGLPFLLEAFDAAGNLTAASVSTEDASLSVPLPELASAAEIPNGLLAVQNLSKEDENSVVDKSPPKLDLKDSDSLRLTFRDRALLEGSVSDDVSVKSLTINGEEILRRSGKKIFFSHLLPLVPGENQFAVRAEDSSGKVLKSTITVERKIQKVRQLGARMSIAVLPFEYSGDVSIAAKTVYDRLIASFYEQGRFKMVERTKINEILSELNLSQTNLANPETAAKMGRIIAPDALLAGTIHESDQSMEIVTRLIDTESSTVMGVNDAYTDDKTFSASADLSEKVAFKYKRDFPILEGRIIDVDGKEILVDLGSEDEIKGLVKLIIFRESKGLKHRTTGKVIDQDAVELGQARVKNVFPNSSKADEIKRLAEYGANDGVITK